MCTLFRIRLLIIETNLFTCQKLTFYVFMELVTSFDLLLGNFCRLASKISCSSTSLFSCISLSNSSNRLASSMSIIPSNNACCDLNLALCNKGYSYLQKMISLTHPSCLVAIYQQSLLYMSYQIKLCLCLSYSQCNEDTLTSKFSSSRWTFF